MLDFRGGRWIFGPTLTSSQKQTKPRIRVGYGVKWIHVREGEQVKVRHTK